MTRAPARQVLSALAVALVVVASTSCVGGDDAPPSAQGQAASVPARASVVGGPTRFGAAPEGGQNAKGYAAALTRTEKTLGVLDVVRVFYKGMPEPWPGKAPGRDVVVSFKIDPSRVLSGSVDDAMRSWFRSAPDDLTVNWVYFHEPENDVEDGAFTAAEFRSAFAHLSRLSREAENPGLRATLVLQSYTLKPASGREWRDFYPGDAAVDVFAWDVYNRPSGAMPYTRAEDLLDGLRAVAESTGHPFALAELGSVLADGDDGTGRAAWLRAVGQYAKQHDADFVCYFDLDFLEKSADYRLRDTPSVTAWRSLSTT